MVELRASNLTRNLDQANKMTEPNHDDNTNTEDNDNSSYCSTENYQELGYEPINDFCDGDDENYFEADFSEHNFEEGVDQSKELTFENFDDDFEKALSFVLQNTLSNEPKNITTIKKKKIKITLGEKDPSQKIKYISHDEETLIERHTTDVTPEQPPISNDIEMNKESVESIKNIIRDLNFTPTKPASWFSEDDWLVKLKNIKDNQ